MGEGLGYGSRAHKGSNPDFALIILHELGWATLTYAFTPAAVRLKSLTLAFHSHCEPEVCERT